MKVEKKHIIIGAVTLFVISSIYTMENLIDDAKNKADNKNTSNQMIEENSNSFNEKDEEFYNDYYKDNALEGFNEENKVNPSEIVIEEDFKTSIGTGNTDEEIRYNNELLNESKFSLKGRIKAKNVAENYIQAIVSFNIEKPKETVDKATKYVIDSKKSEVEALYIYLGKYNDIKKTVINEVSSNEEENEDDNEYILFDVTVDWDVIDQYDQKVKGSRESYEVKLLNVNGEYKVIEYRIS